MPVLPWDLPGAGGRPLGLSFAMLRELAPPAFAIAMLGAIESLLSATVADGMTGGSHDPDGELVAQGIGNLLGPFFGGIPATGAIARTATNVRSGARSPLAAAFHALFVLLAVLAAAPLLGWLPMASLAALLLLVAWNMSEVRHFAHTVRMAPRSDVVVLLTCFGLTVLFDMVVAVGVGVTLAAFLFMRRMVEVTGVRLGGDSHPIASEGLPPDAMVYEVAGPLFFGAARKAMSALQRAAPGVSVVIFDLSSVPVIDATGLVNLESAIERLHAAHAFVILAGVQRQPARALLRSGLRRRSDRLAICRSFEAAAAIARRRSRASNPHGIRPAATAAPS
jgi:SulP family sulfate permease